MYVLIASKLFDDLPPLVWADGVVYPKVGWTGDLEKAHLYASEHAATSAIEQLKYRAYPVPLEEAKILFNQNLET